MTVLSVPVPEPCVVARVYGADSVAAGGVALKRRKLRYGLFMGACVLLFAGALPVYYQFGAGWAVAMCVVASVLPLVAMTVGSIADPADPRDRDNRYGPNAE